MSLVPDRPPHDSEPPYDPRSDGEQNHGEERLDSHPRHLQEDDPDTDEAHSHQEHQAKCHPRLVASLAEGLRQTPRIVERDQTARKIVPVGAFLDVHPMLIR